MLSIASAKSSSLSQNIFGWLRTSFTVFSSPKESKIVVLLFCALWLIYNTIKSHQVRFKPNWSGLMENISLRIFLGFPHIFSNCIGNEVISRKGSSIANQKIKKRMLPEAWSGWSCYSTCSKEKKNAVGLLRDFPVFHPVSPCVVFHIK